MVPFRAPCPNLLEINALQQHFAFSFVPHSCPKRALIVPYSCPSQLVLTDGVSLAGSR